MSADRPPTPRQLEVLAAHVLYGRKGAAARLSLSENTVRSQLANMRRRMGAETTGELLVMLGWLRLP